MLHAQVDYIASYFRHTEYAHAHVRSHVTRLVIIFLGYVRIEIKYVIINAVTWSQKLISLKAASWQIILSAWYM